MNSFFFPLVEHTELSAHIEIWGKRMNFDIRALRRFQPNCLPFWPKERFGICVHSRAFISDYLASNHAIRVTAKKAHARYVSTRPAEAGHKPNFDRIDAIRKDNRDF
jgi:hypothetical protein